MEKVLKIILAIIISPVAAFWQVGLTKHFWINLALFIFLPWIGGVVHGLWLVLTDKQS